MANKRSFFERLTGSVSLTDDTEELSDEKKEEMLRLIVDGARLARNLKLGVNAGHGLNYTTIKAFKGVSEISEFSIGHSIIARAVLVGLERAVREMIAIIHLL